MSSTSQTRLTLKSIFLFLSGIIVRQQYKDALNSIKSLHSFVCRLNKRSYEKERKSLRELVQFFSEFILK